MDRYHILIEGIGWFSTAAFLISIILPNRTHLHELGILTSITTGIYAYIHGATAIWVKWIFAFFFHLVMWRKLKILENHPQKRAEEHSSTAAPLPIRQPGHPIEACPP